MEQGRWGVRHWYSYFAGKYKLKLVNDIYNVTKCFGSKCNICLNQSIWYYFLKTY